MALFNSSSHVVDVLVYPGQAETVWSAKKKKKKAKNRTERNRSGNMSVWQVFIANSYRAANIFFSFHTRRFAFY